MALASDKIVFTSKHLVAPTSKFGIHLSGAKLDAHRQQINISVALSSLKETIKHVD